MLHNFLPARKSLKTLYTNVPVTGEPNPYCLERFSTFITIAMKELYGAFLREFLSFIS